jgi:hypothetical protein
LLRGVNQLVADEYVSLKLVNADRLYNDSANGTEEPTAEDTNGET